LFIDIKITNKTPSEQFQKSNRKIEGTDKTGLYITGNEWAIQLVLTPPHLTKMPEQKKSIKPGK
jgi:hypothetical protein